MSLNLIIMIALIAFLSVALIGAIVGIVISTKEQREFNETTLPSTGIADLDEIYKEEESVEEKKTTGFVLEDGNTGSSFLDGNIPDTITADDDGSDSNTKIDDLF